MGPGPPLLISGAGEVSVDLASDVALEHAGDFGLGASLVEAAFDVGVGGGIGCQAGEHDPPQRMVRLTVPAPVESMAGEFA